MKNKQENVLQELATGSYRDVVKSWPASRFSYTLEPCVSAFLHLRCDFLQNTHFLPVCLSPLKFCNDSICTKRDFHTEFPICAKHLHTATFGCVDGIIGVGKPQRMCRPQGVQEGASYFFPPRGSQESIEAARLVWQARFPTETSCHLGSQMSAKCT